AGQSESVSLRLGWRHTLVHESDLSRVPENSGQALCRIRAFETCVKLCEIHGICNRDTQGQPSGRSSGQRKRISKHVGAATARGVRESSYLKTGIESHWCGVGSKEQRSA